MKLKKFFFGTFCFVSIIPKISLAQNTSVNDNSKPWYVQYQDWKNKVATDTGFSYSVDLSVLAQRGAPNGSGTSLQFQVFPNISWEIFNNDYGSGTINVNYTPTRYWNITISWNR